jgi:hypothetical protein
MISVRVIVPVLFLFFFLKGGIDGVVPDATFSLKNKKKKIHMRWK